MFDKKVILGIGIGIVICSMIMILTPREDISKFEIEKRARDMGMIYKDEVKALYDN